jgi:hypothetical protein
MAAYKPPNSHPESEPRVFDFVGMLGLPLVPCHTFPATAPTGFFSLHALKDPNLSTQLAAFINAGKPTLVTDGLAKRLKGHVALNVANVQIVPVRGEPKRLLKLPQAKLDGLRKLVLQPLRHSFQAPHRVALYLFADGSWVVENFADIPATIELDGTTHKVPARGWIYQWQGEHRS